MAVNNKFLPPFCRKYSSSLSSGSPWGAGTFAGADGSLSPNKSELEVARLQGEHFYKTVSRVSF